jgi:hypothetical protein
MEHIERKAAARSKQLCGRGWSLPEKDVERSIPTSRREDRAITHDA